MKIMFYQKFEVKIVSGLLSVLLVFSLTGCSGVNTETLKGSKSPSGMSLGQAAANVSASETETGESLEGPVIKEYIENKLDLSQLYSDVKNGSETVIVDIKKIDGEYCLLAKKMSTSHTLEFDILKFKDGETVPRFVKIVPDNLSLDMLNEMKAYGDSSEYLTARISEEGSVNCDFYICCTLGDDGNVYALKSVTEYTLPKEGEKIKIDKSTALCVWDPEGQALEETILNDSYFDTIVQTKGGVVLLGSVDGKYVCGKAGKDGELAKKEIDRSAMDQFITSPEGELCQITKDGTGYQIKFYDEDLNVYKTESLPGINSETKVLSSISLASADTVVYAENGTISSLNFVDKKTEQLYRSRTDSYKMVFLDENGDICAVYFDSESKQYALSVYKEGERALPTPQEDPEQPVFIELSDDEKKGIEEYDREKIYSMNPDEDLLPVIEDGPGASLIRTIYGTYTDMKVTSPKDALLSLYQVKSLLGIKEPEKELKYVKSVSGGVSATTTYMFSYVYKGVDVPNVGIRVHVDKDGYTSTLQNGFEGYESFDKLDVKAGITAEDAEAVVTALGKEVHGTPELMIYYDYEKHEAVLIYLVHTFGKNYMIEAHSGNIYMEVDTIYT